MLKVEIPEHFESSSKKLCGLGIFQWGVRAWAIEYLLWSNMSEYMMLYLVQPFFYFLVPLDRFLSEYIDVGNPPMSTKNSIYRSVIKRWLIWHESYLIGKNLYLKLLSCMFSWDVLSRFSCLVFLFHSFFLSVNHSVLPSKEQIRDKFISLQEH